ncbi:hypothetical protein SAMN05216480_11384 [Pustulibacterium marinum]|uniref:Nicotinic acid mononucleotide adenyltransferase n=1 Tax=Pustulibacterium marinum TaxID=1224947 RepID=A0A1I7I7P2_9FLAO|nr:nicotinic acid mononucleotide adenyltransferase [Pustulibacterium marinum]SFU68911.1 hypothetical protein SAMN05216480_11384 [Pustulibacterium marinum]
MKTIKLLFVSFLALASFSACTNTVYIEDDYVEPSITLNQLIHSYELWYIDINQSTVNGNIPFMQIAFTLSFRNGTLYANNNMVGFGSNGNGYGIDVGYYDAYGSTLQLDHDLDGVWNFSVQQLGTNTIELYNYETDSSFVLRGYQRSTFDYDYVFYENIHYFLQEYEAWEKVYTSQEGAINDFDAENFLAFLSDGYGDTFLSSIDGNGTPVSNIYWDYEGIYEVLNVDGDVYAKVLTLDYDYLGNEYFELYVINDETVELYHPYSGTTYRFKGRGYIQYMRSANAKGKTSSEETRKLRVKENNRTFKAEEFKSLK